VQGSTQSNTSQIVAVYNDAGAANLTLNVKLLYNTFVGTTGGRAALVHLSNDDATTMSRRAGRQYRLRDEQAHAG